MLKSGAFFEKTKTIYCIDDWQVSLRFIKDSENSSSLRNSFCIAMKKQDENGPISKAQKAQNIFLEKNEIFRKKIFSKIVA